MMKSLLVVLTILYFLLINCNSTPKKVNTAKPEDSYYRGLREYTSYLNHYSDVSHFISIEAISKNDSTFFNVDDVSSLISIYDALIKGIDSIGEYTAILIGDFPNPIIHNTDGTIDKEKLFKRFFLKDYEFFHKNGYFRINEIIDDEIKSLYMVYKGKSLVNCRIK